MIDWLNQGGAWLWVMAVLGMTLYTLVIQRGLDLYSTQWGTQRRQLRWEQCLAHDLNQLSRQDALAHLHAVDAQHLNAHLALIRALVQSLILLGLLGTVTGMMAAYGTTGMGSEMQRGLDTALLTTQYALTLAIPAWFLHRLMVKQSHRRQQEGQQLMLQLAHSRGSRR